MVLTLDCQYSVLVGWIAVQFFLQPDFDKRLIGRIPHIGCHLDAAWQMLRELQRNGFGAWSQVRQSDLFSFFYVWFFKALGNRGGAHDVWAAYRLGEFGFQRTKHRFYVHRHREEQLAGELPLKYSCHIRKLWFLDTKYLFEKYL